MRLRMIVVVVSLFAGMYFLNQWAQNLNKVNWVGAHTAMIDAAVQK